MLDSNFCEQLYNLANEAFENDEIPVSAIIVKNGEIIASGINTRHNDKSVLGHAEINAIEKACKVINDWRLDECDMYVSLVPCMMCTGAIIESRIKNVYFLCNKTNICFDSYKYINIFKIENAEYEEKYLKLLRLFFEKKRNNL